MTNRNLVEEVDHLYARQAALEAAFTQLVAPIFLRSFPDVALPLVQEMRTLKVRASRPKHERLVLLAEESIQALADQIEHLIRKSAEAK